MYGSFMSLVPALVAIVLALITKEVYSSLFIGILMGGIFFAFGNGHGLVEAFTHVLGIGDGEYGLVKCLSDPYNVGILIFLIILGSLVSLMNKSGGSKAFGEWASKNIKSKVGAMLSTILLGVLIFIDDYFNCLTVGSVMKPITDKHHISREKLAYLIDATAAPICIIAPISSWAAAVSGFVDGENGLTLFINAIPYNYYALLTIAMLVILSILSVDFGPMKKFESNADESIKNADKGIENKDVIGNGKVIDLVVPIVVLVVFCVIGMIYSGGFFGAERTNFIDAFANSDASVGLVIGSVLTIIFAIIFYTIRRVLKFTDCMQSLVDGFKNMAPAILILCFAWTLKSMTDSLGAKTFVNTIIGGNIETFSIFIPALVFVIGAFISFSTGTSWGTFGILIPIVVSVFQGQDRTLMIMSISACMAGSIFGDHCSPISDTTIMSSAGAGCVHINHVNTQLPYALTVAAIAFICYLLVGLIKNPILPLLIGIILLFAVIKLLGKKTITTN